MALALFFIGLILVISGIKGTQSELAALFASEFTGANSFWKFIAGIVFLGMLGYIPALRNTSRALIVLVLLVLLLTNGGFWTKITEAVGNPQAIAAPPSEEVPDAVDVSAAGAAIGKGAAASIAKLAADNMLTGGAGAGGAAVAGILGALF